LSENEISDFSISKFVNQKPLIEFFPLQKVAGGFRVLCVAGSVCSAQPADTSRRGLPMEQHVPSKETLRKMRMHIRYDRSSGNLFWRSRQPEHFLTRSAEMDAFAAKSWNRKNAWTEAFANIAKNGEKWGYFERKKYFQCQVAFFFENGFWNEG